MSRVYHRSFGMQEVDDIELGPATLTQKPRTSLLKAVEDNDINVVYLWLDWMKENPNSPEELADKDALGNTAAHLAAKLNRYEIMEMLLGSQIGVDLNVCNADALTPMHLACIKGHLKTVNIMLHYLPAESKKRISSAKDGPLQLAMFYCHKDVALAILKDSKEFVSVCGDEQISPLHLAAKFDLLNVIDYLLESGADIEGKDDQLHTPLMVAILSGHVNASLRLVNKGARTDRIDSQQRNIVHLAAEQDMVAILQVVDSTFFRSACQAYDSTKSTPLHIAVSKGSLAVVDLIMKDNAPINVKNSSEQTPLHVAAECGNARVMQRFLNNRRVALNTFDKDGCTPLHLACQQGHIAIAEMLVKSGAMIHFKNNQQRTPLVCAVCAGSSDIVKLLLKAEAGTTVDHGKEDILSLAMMNGASVEVALSLLAGGLISKKTNLCEPIVKMPALVKGLLNECIEGCTANDTLQKVLKEKRHCLFTLDFEPIGSFTFDFNKESHPLSLMVEHKCLELLKHPVITILIKYKWKKYGQFLYHFNLCFYAIFLIFLTSFALVVLNPSHSTCLSPSRSQFIQGAAFVVVFLVSIRIIFEIFQFMRLKLGYFKEVINWMEIVLYFSTLNFVWIFHSPCFCVTSRQWELGIIAVFLGWFILTLFTDKLPLTGLYVLMFISILKTFLKTIVLSLLLIVSFGLAFFMLFHSPNILHSPFASPFISLMKTMTMSEGEFDFDENFAIDRGGTTPSIAYPITSFFLWLIFLVLMSILLTNLLIDFLLSMDGFIYQFQDFIPNFVYKWLTSKNKITVLVYNKLSAWQKLQLSIFEQDHDLHVSAQEFLSFTEDCTIKSVQGCVHKRDLNLKMTELQEEMERIQLNQKKIGSQVKKTIYDLEAHVTKLSNENQEIKKGLSELTRQNLELKQTILELSDYNHWQKDIISNIAKQLSVSSSDTNVSLFD